MEGLRISPVSSRMTAQMHGWRQPGGTHPRGGVLCAVSARLERGHARVDGGQQLPRHAALPGLRHGQRLQLYLPRWGPGLHRLSQQQATRRIYSTPESQPRAWLRIWRQCEMPWRWNPLPDCAEMRTKLVAGWWRRVLSGGSKGAETHREVQRVLSWGDFHRRAVRQWVQPVGRPVARHVLRGWPVWGRAATAAGHGAGGDLHVGQPLGPVQPVSRAGTVRRVWWGGAGEGGHALSVRMLKESQQAILHAHPLTVIGATATVHWCGRLPVQCLPGRVRLPRHVSSLYSFSPLKCCKNIDMPRNEQSHWMRRHSQAFRLSSVSCR